jgi:hypothetical protein
MEIQLWYRVLVIIWEILIINWYKVGSATNYTDGPSYLTGRVCEISVFTAMDSTGIAIVEGYLAWKYGLQSLLPDSHTYKGAPPT